MPEPVGFLWFPQPSVSPYTRSSIISAVKRLDRSVWRTKANSIIEKRKDENFPSEIKSGRKASRLAQCKQPFVICSWSRWKSRQRKSIWWFWQRRALTAIGREDDNGEKLWQKWKRNKDEISCTQVWVRMKNKLTWSWGREFLYIHVWQCLWWVLKIIVFGAIGQFDLKLD